MTNNKIFEFFENDVIFTPTLYKKKCSVFASKVAINTTCKTIDVAVCSINRHNVLLIQCNSTHKKGAIGINEGEMITCAFEYATKKHMPVIAVIDSSGMKIDEGTLALMQMIKISAAVKAHRDRNLLYICIINGMSLGGVSASFVSLADILIAEKNSIYGFSGKRIIQKTTHEKLPNDFQSAEYAERHGMVDIVAEESEIEMIVKKLVTYHMI